MQGIIFSLVLIILCYSTSVSYFSKDSYEVKNAANYFFDKEELTKDSNEVVPVPQGRRLREIVADLYPNGNLFIGGTTSGELLNTGAGQILQREFSYITPANDFKQTKIHPEPNKWDWTTADRWVSVAQENKQVIRMHSPISPQCSDWAREDNRTDE
jgi:hypothetical protein